MNKKAILDCQIAKAIKCSLRIVFCWHIIQLFRYFSIFPSSPFYPLLSIVLFPFISLQSSPGRN